MATFGDDFSETKLNKPYMQGKWAGNRMYNCEKQIKTYLSSRLCLWDQWLGIVQVQYVCILSYQMFLDGPRKYVTEV